MSMMVSFCAVLFSPRDILDEILNLIESVSEGFPTYSRIYCYSVKEPYDRNTSFYSTPACVMSPANGYGRP